MNIIPHFCQKCLSANPLGLEFCVQCGTRLMLVVEPPAARFEADEAVIVHEEHLLERVSSLENRLARLTDKLQQTLDLLLKHARNSYYDHTLIETLVGVLDEAGVVEDESLRRLWREQCSRDAEEFDESNRHGALRQKIVASYRGPEPEVFERLVSESLDLLETKEAALGMRQLERAARMSRGNAPLLSFLGEQFFRSGRMVLARSYLTQAFKTAPEDVGICLLLGLVCGDEGETERARELLCRTVESGRESFAAHYGLGRLLAAEQRWTEALVQFKRALAARPSPEAHYVVGSVYYRLGRDRMAARHLRKAVEMDKEYSAALFMLGLVYLRGGELERARAAFDAARQTGQGEPHYRLSARRFLAAKDAPVVPPLFATARQARRQLVLSGDKRLAQAVREDALALMSGPKDKH
jgi:tetratricopeptide (TPR) repeat protein